MSTFLIRFVNSEVPTQLSSRGWVDHVPHLIHIVEVPGMEPATSWPVVRHMSIRKKKTVMFVKLYIYKVPTYVLAVVKYADGFSGVPLINSVLGRTVSRSTFRWLRCHRNVDPETVLPRIGLIRGTPEKPSAYIYNSCFCPVGLSLLKQHYQQVLWVLKLLLFPGLGSWQSFKSQIIVIVSF